MGTKFIIVRITKSGELTVISTHDTVEELPKVLETYRLSDPEHEYEALVIVDM